MRRISKRKFVFCVSAILVVCLFGLLILIMNRNNDTKAKQDDPQAAEEEFVYDSLLPTRQYAEHMVLYVDEQSVLHMIDTASGKDMVYCDRPNCTHESFNAKTNPNPSCPAVFAGVLRSGPVLHNKHLYFIGNLTNEDVFTKQYLYETDANGENRKKGATLEGVQQVPYVLYRDNYVLGAYRNDCEVNEDGQIINDNKLETGVFVIDLNSFKVQMGERLTDDQTISDIYYADRAVYYFCSHLDVDMSELMEYNAPDLDYTEFFLEHMIYEYFRYDIAGGKTELLAKIDHVSSAYFADGDLYYETQEGCFVYDRKSGATNKLQIPSGARGFHKVNDALYFSVYDNGSKKSTYYRLKDGKVDALMSSKFTITNICGDSVYVGYSDEDGESVQGVMSLEDFDHGKAVVRRLGQGDGSTEVIDGTEVVDGTGVKNSTEVGDDPENDADQGNDADDANVRVIRFAVPADLCRVSPEKVRYFNEALRKDGHPYRLELVELGNDAGSSEYAQMLEKQLKKGEIDIAFLGLNNSQRGNRAYNLIKAGFALDLSEILSQGRGKDLFEAFPKNLWETVKCNGHIYSIPVCDMTGELAVYAAFNRNVLSDDVIDSWGGSIEGIYEMLRNAEWDDSKAPRFQYLIDRYDFAGMIGCEVRFGLVYDYDTLTVESPAESEKIIGFLKVLEQMKKDGFMGINSAYTHTDTYNAEVYMSKVEKRIETGDYVVALSEGEVEEAFLKDNITVKKAKEYLSSRLSGTIAISKNAESVDEIVDFLCLLYSDGKYGNILLYGREGKDYKAVDGVACNLDGSALQAEVFDRMCLNLFVNVYPGSYDTNAFRSKEEAFAYYDRVELSPFLGFQTDTGKMGGLGRIVDDFVINALLLERDLDTIVSETSSKLKSKGIDKYLDSVRSQWEEWQK